MQADQTVISLRPGGGAGPRGSRFSFGISATSSSDSLPLRAYGGFKTGDLRFEGHEHVQYTRDQLLQLREVTDVPENILKIRQEIEAEFIGEDQSWGHGDGNPQSQSRYSEPDTRDWRGRSAHLPASGEGRSWEALQESESRAQEANLNQEQLNSQFARSKISSNQGWSEKVLQFEGLREYLGDISVDYESCIEKVNFCQRYLVGRVWLPGYPKPKIINV